jgi:hypothetical protein
MEVIQIDPEPRREIIQLPEPIRMPFGNSRNKIVLARLYIHRSRYTHQAIKATSARVSKTGIGNCLDDR